MEVDMGAQVQNFPIKLQDIPKFIDNETDAIVIVDDDPEQLDIMKMYYQKSGRNNQLLIFQSAVEILEHLNKCVDGVAKLPSLIMLDINMPDVTGFEVLERIRQRDGFEKLPVIIMFSSSPYRDDIEKAKDLGATGYITKPSKSAEYLLIFRSI